MNTKIEVVYVHREEYQSLDSQGKWSDIQIRYSNLTTDEKQARARHLECKDVEHTFGREFERIYGYRYRNCKLVKRETKTIITETEI